MSADRVYKKNDQIVTREIAGEVILIPLFKSSDALNYIYTLNETAARFWSLVDGKKTLEEIKKEIVENYDVAEETVDKNVAELVTDLKSFEALL